MSRPHDPIASGMTTQTTAEVTDDLLRFVQPLTGATILMDATDLRARRLAAEPGFNDTSVMLWLTCLSLNAWDVAVDVGANYGEMTLAVLPRHARRVVSYEANPHVADILERSVDLNARTVDVRRVAAGRRPGEATFTVDRQWSGTSGITAHLGGRHSSDVRQVRVPVTTLDADFADLDPGASVVLKIDVEGGEEEVLAGARHLMSPDRVWAAMVEVLHFTPQQFALLTQQFDVLMVDWRAEQMVRIPPLHPGSAQMVRSSRWFHAQDVVLVSRAFLEKANRHGK